jgi:peptidoglycan/xylan/chitin deacetylase (PgdA/CDA1 family)
VSSEFALRWARRVRGRRSLILLYHGIGVANPRTDPGFLRVAPESFRAQLDLLVAAGFEFVTVAEFAERAEGQEPHPGLVALSFDDGMDDNHTVVLPMLQERGLRATVYVATGLIGKRNPWMTHEAGSRMMTVEELRDLVAAGFEIGAHTVTHADLSKLDFESCLWEMTESRVALERMLKVPVRTFAYPFCHYSAVAVAAAQDAGFSAAVTCGGLGSWRRYELQRSLVSGKDGMPSFLLKLAGLHQPLFDSMPGRLGRAATRPLRTAKRMRDYEEGQRGPR